MNDLTLMELDAADRDALCRVARALCVPVRLDILELLYLNPMSVNDVADALNLPKSSAGAHLRTLEEAGLVRTERKVEDGAVFKLCVAERNMIRIMLRPSREGVNTLTTINVPIGSYMDCEVEKPCGMISESGYVGVEDDPGSFYLPGKLNAQMIWMAKGFLSYKAPNRLPKYKRCLRISVSMELCSEAPGFDENYASDISLYINNVFCGAYHADGDYGKRRGILTPGFWQSGLTQYGKLAVWSVDEAGASVNGVQTGALTIEDLKLESLPYIGLRIESTGAHAGEQCGGFNLFGAHAGDYAQNIVITLEH